MNGGKAMKQAKISAIALAIAVLLGCNATSIDLKKVADAAGGLQTVAKPKEMTPEEEQTLGNNAAAVLVGAAPLVQKPEVQKYLNELGMWIAQQTSRPDLPWRFGIIDSPNVNAFATPSGHVLVTRGLVARLNDEAELAGVLAHEIAHVVRRHYVQAAMKRDRANALGQVVGAVATVKVANQEMLPSLVNLSKGMYASGLDKDDEYEADRLAVVYATRAGYDPYGLPRVLNMYAEKAGGGGFDLLFSTHPMPEDRLDKLGNAMGEKLAAYEKGGARNNNNFKRFAAQLGK